MVKNDSVCLSLFFFLPPELTALSGTSYVSALSSSVEGVSVQTVKTNVQSKAVRLE